MGPGTSASTAHEFQSPNRAAFTSRTYSSRVYSTTARELHFRRRQMKLIAPLFFQLRSFRLSSTPARILQELTSFPYSSSSAFGAPNFARFWQARNAHASPKISLPNGLPLSTESGH